MRLAPPASINSYQGAAEISPIIRRVIRVLLCDARLCSSQPIALGFPVRIVVDIPVGAVVGVGWCWLVLVGVVWCYCCCCRRSYCWLLTPCFFFFFVQDMELSLRRQGTREHGELHDLR